MYHRTGSKPICDDVAKMSRQTDDAGPITVALRPHKMIAGYKRNAGQRNMP